MTGLQPVINILIRVTCTITAKRVNMIIIKNITDTNHIAYVLLEEAIRARICSTEGC